MATHNLLRLPRVEAVIGYKKSTIYRLIQKGEFPAPISLSPNANGRACAWVEEEVNDWVKRRIAASRNKGGV